MFDGNQVKMLCNRMQTQLIIKQQVGAVLSRIGKSRNVIKKLLQILTGIEKTQ